MRTTYGALLFVGTILLALSIAYGQECQASPVDVYFLAESTLDIGKPGFDQLKKFITDVARNIAIGPDSNRLSITLFNRDVIDILDLKDSQRLKALNDLMAKTKYWHGGQRTTNIGKALQYMVDNKFSEEKGRRPEADAVCVIVLEGVASDMSEAPAAILREHCRVVVLGINRPNYYELSRIASKPILGHIKTLQGYIDLVRFDKWVASTICKPPISKMQLQRGRITHDSIQIMWEQQPYAAEYIVNIRLSGKRKPLKTRRIPRTVNNVTFTDLREGTRYSFDAWPVDKDRVRGPRAVFFISSGIRVPEVKLNTLSVTKTSAVVSWSRSKLSGVSYFITVREAETQLLIENTVVPDTRYTITRLRPGIGYSVELAAVFKGARSDSDARLIFFTVPDPPLPSLSYVTDRGVKLEWKAIQGASSYGVRTYDTETGTGIELLVRVDNTTENAIEIGPLLSGKRYSFTATSKTSAGTESEESKPVLQRIALPNPRKIQLVSRTTKSINITWDAPEGVTQYMVRFKTSLSPDLITRMTSTSYFFVNGLAIGATYVFNVYSVGQDSTSDTQNPAVAFIQTVPGKVDSLLIQSITQNSVTLHWSKTRGATEYLLRFKDAKTKEVLQTVRAKGDTTEVDGLKTGITYLITVAGVGAEGDVVGKESDPQMVITLPDVPGKPSLKEKTNNTLTFKWDAVQGAVQYLLSILEEGNTGPDQFRTRSTSYTFDDLKPGTRYEVSLRSVGTGGRINMESSESGRGQTVPRTPDKPRITDLTATTVTVTWDKVKGAVGYILKIRMAGKRRMLEIETRNTTETSYRIANLRGGESYHATVIAYGTDGIQTAESKFTLMKTMPEVPGKPRVLGVSSSTVSLEWDEVKGVSGYVISVSDKRKLTEVHADTNKFTVGNLKPSTHYSFGLYSVAIEGTRNEKESERTEAVTAPSPPSEVRVTKAGTTFVELTWNSVRGGVSYFVRYKSIGDDKGLESGEVKATERFSQTVPKLTAGVIYEFSVFAVGQDGSRSDPGILIDGTLPETPDEPLVLLIGSVNATLSWNPAKGALSYIVMARSKGFEKKFTSDTTRVQIDGLQPGTKYDFTVMSVGINGRVNQMESKKETDQTLTSPPRNFRRGAVTTTEIEVSWDKRKGAVSYSVSVQYADGTPVRKYVATQATYTIKRLEPGKTYSIRVASVGTNLLESYFSEPIIVSTVPDSPGLPQLVNVTSTSVRLKWKPVEGAMQYTLGVREDGQQNIEKFTVDETQILVVELDPGTWYNFFIYAVGTDGQMSIDHSGEVNVQTVPATPPNFSIVNVTTSSIAFKWDKVKGASIYVVSVMEGDDTKKNLRTPDNIVTVQELQPGTAYTFKLHAESMEGKRSERSKPIVESTFTEVPMQPVLTNLTGTMATLEWSPVPGATRYAVFYINRDIDERKKEEVTDTKVVLQNLEPGTWYDFSVMSLGAEGKASEESDILDEQTMPLPPKNVQIKSVGMDFINVVWDKSKGASSYKASYSYNDEKNELMKSSFPAEKLSAKFSDLSPGTEFKITIQSVGQTGSVSVGSQPVIENTIPSTPGSPVVKNVAATMFQAQWEAVKGADSYVVEITPKVGRKFVRETENTEWTEQGLKPGKWFEVKVQSKDKKDRGNGIPTELIEIQTVCLQPSNVKMGDIGTTWVKFGWEEMEGANFYLITMMWSVKDDIINTFGGQEVQKRKIISWEGNRGKKKDGLKESKLQQYEVDPLQVVVKDHTAWFRIQTRTNKIEITGLDSALSYNFLFETVNKQGRVSEKKAEINETTLPDTVEFVALMGITESSAMFGWDAVEGVDHYVVVVTQQLDGVVETLTTEKATITLQELAPGSWYNAEVFTVGMKGKRNNVGSETLSFQTIPSPPVNVKIVNVATTSIELEWKESEGISHYKVITRLASSYNVLFRAEESKTNQHIVENLTPGTKYLLSVVSVSTGGRDSQPSKNLVETTIPAKPVNLRLMDVTAESVSLQWVDVEGAVQFIVTVLGDDRTKKEQRTTGTLITIENLIPGVWYEFWVRSVGINGRVNEEKSNIVRQQTVPQSPGIVKIEAVTTTTISLSWRKVHGIKQYRVLVEDGSGSQLIHNVTRSFFTLSQLTPGESYKIYVIAVGTSGQNSEKSNTVEIATVPAPVGKINVVGVSGSHIEVQWMPVKGATEYNIILRSPSTGRVLRLIKTRQPSHFVTPLDPGATYVFSVTVKGKNEKSSGENPPTTVQTTPLSPTDVKATKVTVTSLELSWKAVPGVKLYKVIIREQVSPDDTLRTDEIQKTKHVVSGLRPGTTYLLGVVTVGTSGRESDSSEIIAENTHPEKPSGLAVTQSNTTSMTLEWNPVAGVRHYTVFVKGSSSKSKEFVVFEKKTSIPALSPGTWYEMSVVAVGEKKRESQRSDEIRDQTVPLSPARIVARNVGTASISIQWEPVTGVKFYEVLIESANKETKKSTKIFIADEPDYVINELPPGVEHVIRVVGVGTSGRKSEPSEPLRQTTVPAALDEIVVKSATTTSITLEWMEITGASGYTIFIRSASDRSGAILRTIETTLTTYEVPALVPGEGYFFTVRSKGHGEKLSKESPRARAQTVPLPPSRLRITDVGAATIGLAWKEANGAEFYRVFTWKEGDELVKTDDVKRTEHKVDGLTSGTQYFFTVSAIGRSGRESEESSPIAQLTKPSQPSEVAASVVETTSIAMTWKEVKGARSYRVTVEDLDRNKKKQEEYKKQEYEAFINRYTITNLEPGTLYAITITSVGVDSQESVPSQRLIEQTVPSSPENVVLTDVKETSMTVKWDRVYGVVNYVIIVTDPVTGSETRLESKTNQVKVSQLSPGTEYEVLILSVGNKERVNPIPSKSLIEQTVSSPVEGLRIISVTATTATLKWNRSPGVVRYIIRVRDHSTGTLLETFESITLQILMEDLLPGQNYSFTVSSVAKNGKETDESDEVVASTKIATPSKPQMQRVTETSITLVWDEVGGSREYIVIVHDKEQRRKIRISVEEEFVVVADLLPGYSYSFSLVAIGTSGETSQEGPAAVIDTIPSAPEVSQVDATSATSITFSWQKVKGAVRYTIVARWLPPGEKKRQSVNATTIRTSHRMELPLPGTGYEISFRAEGRSGPSATSSVLRENTLPETPLPPTVSGITSTSMSLSWKSVTGAASYEVVVVDEETRKEKSLTVFRSNAQLNELESGSWYRIRIFSRDVKERANKKGSVPLRIQTVPAVPSNLRIAEVTISSISLAWRKVVGASYYEVEVLALEDDVEVFSDFWKNKNRLHGKVSFVLDTEKNVVIFNGLKPGSTFQFQVRTVGAENRKSDPSRIEVTTLPGTVDEIRVEKVSTNSAALKWADVKGVSFYRVRIRGSEHRPYPPRTVQQSSVTLEQLTPGSWYDVSVVTYDAQNRTSGIRSSVIKFQTVPQQIQNPKTSEVATTSMLITWQPIKGASTYEVKLLWSADDVSPGHMKSEGLPDMEGLSYKLFQTPLTEINMSRLDPGTTYWYEVLSLSEEGRRSEPSKRKNEKTLPSGIHKVTVNKVTETTISLSWDKIKGAETYSVVVTAVGMSGPPISRETKQSQILVQHLDPGITYEFVVQPVGEKRRKEKTQSANLKIKTIPRAPTDVAVQKITESSITVSWSSSAGAIKYQVTSEYKDENRQVQTQAFETTENDFTFTELQPGVRYTIYVVAYGSDLENSISERSDAVIQRTMLSQPQNLKVKEFGEDYVTLSWEASNGALSYLVQATNVESGFTTTINVDDETLSNDVTELTPGVVYSFTVKAVNREDNMMSQESEMVQQRTRPLPPQSVRITNVGSNTIALAWDPVIGAVNFIVFIAEKGGKERSMPNIKKNSILLKDLKPGSEYKIQIIAVTEEGIQSKRSERITQDSAPNAPGTPIVNSFTTTMVELEWGSMKGATSYVVSMTNQESGEKSEHPAGSSLTLRMDELEPATLYSFTVRGENLEKGLKSDESGSVTQSTYPEAPRVHVVSFTPERISISWNPVKGAATYSIFLRLTGEKNPEKEIKRIKETQYTFTKLEVSSEYSIQVQAVMESGMTSDRSRRLLQSTAPNTPTGLKLFNVTQSSFSVSWIAAKGASSYTLFIESEDGGTRFRVDISGDLLHTFYRLKPGTLYSIYAYALTFPDYMRSERSEIIQQRTLAAAPKNLLAFDAKEDSVSLEWRKSKSALSYTIYVIKVEEPRTLERQVKNIITNEATIDRLSPGTLYRFQVAAVIEDGLTGKRSVPATQQTVPAPPQDIVISNVTSTAFKVDWTKSEGATSYRLRVVNQDSKEDRQRTVRDVRVAKIGRLNPGIMYEVTIVAQNKVTDVTSRSSYRVLQRTLPAAPENVRVLKTTAESISLEWKASKGAVSYNVVVYEVNELGLPEGEGFFMDFVEDTFVEIIERLPGTEYQCEVYAVTSEKLISDKAGVVVQRTRYLPPIFPQSAEPLVRLSKATSSSMTAEWDRIRHAITYTLVVRSQRKRDVFIRNIKETSNEITELTADTEYSVTLIAIGRSGDETEESSPPAVLTTLSLPPPVPKGLREVEFTDSSAVVTWEPVPRAISYEIEVTDPDTKRKRVIRDIDQPRFDIKNLIPGKRYLIRIIAVGRFERSESSAQIDIGARHPIPVMPFTGSPPMQASNIQWNSMTLTFPLLPDAVSYTILIRSGKKLFRKLSGLKSRRHVISDLTEVTAYDITYFAVGKGKEQSEQSRPPLSVTTLPHTPDRPTGVGVSDQSAETVVVEWDDSKRAVSYDVHITEQGALVPQVYENVKSPYIAGGLVFDTHYKLTVVAVGKYDRSPPSKEVQFKTKIPKPGAIRLIFIQSVTETQVNLLWSPAAYAVSYTISVRLNGKTVQQMKEILGNSIVVQDLNPGTTYKVGVKAIGLEKDEGNEKIETITTLGSSVQDEERQEVQEFGVDATSPKTVENFNEDEGLNSALPETLEDALSSLIGSMVSIPENEVLEDATENQVLRETSPFRTDLWRRIENVRKLVVLTLKGSLSKKNSDFFSKELEGAEQAMKKLILLSKTLKDSKNFGKTMAKDAALEIAVLLADIFIQTPELGDSGQKDIQDVVGPILEELIVKIVAVPPPVPKGLRIGTSTRKSVSVRWTAVRRGKLSITYIVKVYRPKSKNPLKTFRVVKRTDKSITKLMSKTSYDVTVSSFDVKTELQSKESPRLRIRTK